MEKKTCFMCLIPSSSALKVLAVKMVAVFTHISLGGISSTCHRPLKSCEAR